MKQRIRVLIVDDQTLVREGLRKLLELEPDFEIVGTAGDGEAALATTQRLYEIGTSPDVMLMDIRMPHLDGIATTKALKARWPNVYIVMLTTFDDIELVQAGMQAGAAGYLLKDVTAEQLASTIRAAAHGQVLLQPDIASKVFAAFAAGVTSTAGASPAPTTPKASLIDKDRANQPNLYDAGIESLTEREREILALVAKGVPNRQIAESLFLAEGTVKNHMSNILGKLGVRDRTQAALKARELGLV
jgi:DNA-binding NarL/FixJ family response regulator